MNVKRNGCCTLCDEPVFEITDRFPMDDPRAGQPRGIGKALEGARRIGLVLTDGSTTMLSFCSGCAPGIQDRLGEIWRKCLDTMAFNHENLAAIKGRPLTPQERATSEAGLLSLASIVPLGVVTDLPWSAYDDRLRLGL